MKKILLIIILALIIKDYGYTCTNFLVTKGASKDGSNMITYAADAGGFMEPLFWKPAMDYKEGTMVDIYDWDSGKFLGKIKQVKHTYKVVGNMNEFQLCIGETTFGGLDSLRDTTGILDYGSLIYLALQRAKTAREAIQVIYDLTKEYGYYSSGESFSIADKDEVWVMDVIGKGVGNKGIVYAAWKIPDGYIAAHANQSRIKNLSNDKDECLFSPDVESFAKSKGIAREHNGKFSFCDTYNQLDAESALFCEGRVWRFFSLASPESNLSPDYFRAVKGAEAYPLFIKPANKISVKDLMSWMRDHFEGTEFDMTKGVAAGPNGCPVRWKGLTWKIKGDTVNQYGWERPIGTQQTAFSFIAQLRNWMPDEIGGCFWYGVDHAAMSCYIPLYVGAIAECPKPFKDGSIREFDWESAWWVFNLVSNKAYQFYNVISKDVIKVQSAFEGKFLSLQPYIEETASKIHASDTNAARLFLSDYSTGQSEMVLSRWKELWKYITTRYNDGYINDIEKNNGRSPKGIGYDNEFLKQVIQDKPGYYNVKWKETPRSN